MIYTITASYGQYEDRCDTKMYVTDDLNNARVVMFEMQLNIVAAFHVIAFDCDANSGAIWDLACAAQLEGIYLSISSMKLGVISHGATFVEGVYVEATQKIHYNPEQHYNAEELHSMTKYEILALPYEAKYYGYKH